MQRPIIIGIAGGSGSGKSTVITRIVEDIGPDCVGVLEHDAYYRDLQHLSFDERAAFNFDHPNALETELLVQHIDLLLDGNEIRKPIYDFTQHSRTDRVEIVGPNNPVIIVEGILVLADVRLVERMDIKIFVDTDDDVRLIRRIRRDIAERERSLESVLDQYERTVRPMHIEFVEPSKRRADLIIPRGGRNQVAVSLLMNQIRSMVNRTLIENSL
jgi:uridine kinase